MNRPVHRFALLLSWLTVLALAGPTPAQDGVDAGREREQLMTKIADLEAELTAARKRIAQLEAEVAALRSGTAAPAGNTPSANPFAAPALPPLANPLRAMAAIKDDFQSAAEKANQEDPGVAGAPARRAYMNWARKWVAATNKAYRKQIEWPVRVDDLQAWDAKKTFVTLTALSPDGRMALGKPFVVQMPKRLAERLQSQIDNRKKDDPEHFMLKGVFIPMIRFDQTRMVEGPFNNPPYIGPMVEYFFSVDVASITPPEAPKGKS